MRTVKDMINAPIAGDKWKHERGYIRVYLVRGGKVYYTLFWQRKTSKASLKIQDWKRLAERTVNNSCVTPIPKPMRDK